MDITDSETAGRVRLGDAKEWITDKGCVVHVLMNTDEHAIYGIERLRLIHASEMHERVYLGTGREEERESTKRHFLAVVADGRAEIDSISGTVMQRVFELHNQFLTASLDFR